MLSNELIVFPAIKEDVRGFIKTAWRISMIIYIIIGLIGGFMSGFMGIGGGLVMVPINGIFGKLTQHLAQGTPLAVLSCWL